MKPSSFTSAAEVKKQWRIIDPILKVWSEKRIMALPYAAGSFGPREADLLLERDQRSWVNPGL